MADDAATWTLRLRRLLPRGWFAEAGSTPLLDGLLSGLGYAHAQLSSWIAFARTQTRLATASDIFLDGLAADFLGTRISRQDGESDDAFRARIRREILRPRGTRAALIEALEDLTGVVPLVVEPGCTTDTGGYRAGGVGYGSASAYGSMTLPYQCFATVYRPPGVMPAGVDGYGGSLGGYGVGALEYASSAAVIGVEDAEIYDVIEATRPVATVVWVRLTNVPPMGVGILDDSFILDESQMA